MDWYVLYLKPRTEKKVADYARTLGLSHYLPLRRETKIYQRRKVTVEKPVFPGYFFVSFDRDGRLGLLRTNSIVRILQPDSRRRLLHQLAQVRKALRVDPCLAVCSSLKTGKRVRITGGPFSGIEGIVASLKGKTSVRLNVEMVGQAVAVDVAREFLEVID